MKITTWNVNGIRAREAQVLDWIQKEQPAVLCLQEIKAPEDAIPTSLSGLSDYWTYWHGARGYSGVGLLLKKTQFPEKPNFFHPAFDDEQRIVCAEAGGVNFASIYVPNGGKDFPAKVRFMEAMDAYVAGAIGEGKQLVWCGDLNVARTEIDVHPSLRKPQEIGQTQPERALLERIFANGLTDLGRHLDPANDRLFTWWAPWRNFRQKNYGWRLDYVLTTAALTQRATSCRSDREFGTSDHGPVTAEFAP